MRFRFLWTSGEFQSTFPRGERPRASRYSILFNDFNPRSRVGNDDYKKEIIEMINDFNPRSRVGNDRVTNARGRYSKISIHVPAWGTTFLSNKFHDSIKISIHVPAWGTTHMYCDNCRFNSISIHVPAWGTTEGIVYDLCSGKDFNPRSRVGNDVMIRSGRMDAIYFNPRSRVGNDDRLDYDAFLMTISIHVPAWGTTSYSMMASTLTLFQSTFPRGERRK